MVGFHVSLTILLILGTPFLLLGCLIQHLFEDLCLALLHLVMPRCVGITRRDSCFIKVKEQQWIWE